ncbi:GNAT family N-acetyltransferase [Paenibacillus sp. IB182496]|uniref:GNAT family N-acetyltransferase n=1 Tax=Paenibacillus sabuli TaxID=2772509 RepID=A0A927BXU3_9BACL|nr:GNAT family protein [Paenibacillus sabuli]MBD2847896.1 GNAT family N-acetyltransferase [Paenibacillus sabuli]
MAHMIGERIRLREYRREDVRCMREWVNDPDICNCLSDIFMYPHTLHQTESFVERVLEGQDGHQGFVIAERDTEAYIGQLDLFEIDWKNRCADLGIVIGNRHHHGLGYGREALRLLQRFAFETMNLHRLQLEVHDDNERAIRCYASCGFREEGRQRQRIYRRGAYRDLVWMACLREDYAAATTLEQEA